ncbi:MAG: hypothetical protein JNL66_15690 [Alphaproteobacteria bacterium]|nr:hypothetical protein [Alphaproteobacteria bacterium]
MDIRPSQIATSSLTRTAETAAAARTQVVQNPAATRSLDDARAAARAAFAKVVAQPTRIDPQRLAEAQQAAGAQKPLPRGSLLNIVV